MAKKVVERAPFPAREKLPLGSVADWVDGNYEEWRGYLNGYLSVELVVRVVGQVVGRRVARAEVEAEAEKWVPTTALFTDHTSRHWLRKAN